MEMMNALLCLNKNTVQAHTYLSVSLFQQENIFFIYIYTFFFFGFERDHCTRFHHSPPVAAFFEVEQINTVFRDSI